MSDEHRLKNPQKVLANQLQQYVKRSYIKIKWSTFQEQKKKIITHIDQCDTQRNKIKDKSRVIMTADAEKALDRIRHRFMI